MKVINVNIPDYLKDNLLKVYEYGKQIENQVKTNPLTSKTYINKIRSNKEVSRLITRKEAKLIKLKALKKDFKNYVPIGKDQIEITNKGIILKGFFIPFKIYDKNLKLEMAQIVKTKKSLKLKLFLK